MNAETLESILSCQSLPSLPAVAVKVIDLTSNPNVRLEELAATIQNDQALSAKVLRTVNSSFYGLRQRCATIQRAMVLLGLGPVKTLALGFSLVSATNGKDGDGFDYKAYWRRGLFTATAARCIAEEKGFAWADEAFLAGLLQDVGMIAMHRSLGAQYARVLAEAGVDHRALVKCELSAFEVQHPDIGAMLCQRWKLPDDLVVPVKYHERPTAAPKAYTDVVRCVGLANGVHDALSDPDPLPAIRRIMANAQHWFGLTSDRVDALLKRTAEAGKEMGRLFSLDVGAAPDAEQLVALAQQKMVDLSRVTPFESSLPMGIDALVVNPTDIDPLTGVIGRGGFDSAMRKAFEVSTNSGEVVTVIAVSLDGLGGLTDGAEASDDVLITAAALLRKHLDPCGGVVCRLGGPMFAGLVIGTGHTATLAAAEEFRAEMSAASERWAASKRLTKRIGASIGVASRDPKSASQPGTPQELLSEAAKQVQASRAAGGNAVRAAA
jgi:diguanylate cyclase (GGDEF)-like protein